MKFLSRLEKWVSNSTIADVVCHTDSDGITAAAQLVLYLKSKGVGANVIPGSPEGLRHPAFWRKLKNDLVFFVDIAADYNKDELLRLSSKANVVIIDHHKIMNDMNSDSIIHYHREFLGEEKYYPASKMVYDILGGVDWMMVIGVIGDYGGKNWTDVINKVHEKYGFAPCKDPNCFDSPFTKYDHLISAVRMVYGDKGCVKAVNLLVNSSNWEDFKEKSEVLEDIGKKIDDYIEFVKNDYLRNREVYKDSELAFYELDDPKYKIGSALSTIISSDEPHRTLVIMTRRDKIVNVNLRRQDGKYDMSDLAKKCITKLDASGGGHGVAAGATINSEDFEEFKECLIQTLKEWVSKNKD